ncbi:MAG: hypothetical protein OJF59_001805 [Cytophagales bacterium]|jgi:hypothetical protein|nr:MAG: hypothetical protein OJF59_001805 [Cytophagales bacterium]
MQVVVYKTHKFDKEYINELMNRNRTHSGNCKFWPEGSPNRFHFYLVPRVFQSFNRMQFIF